jgi:tetratricopeptide (TPR) repeat protein
MLTTRFWGSTAVLSCALLFQNCQSNSLSAIEKEGPAKTPLQAVGQPPASETLAHPVGYLPSPPSTTAAHQPEVAIPASSLPILLPSASSSAAFEGAPSSMGIHASARMTPSPHILATPDHRPLAVMPRAAHTAPSRNTPNGTSSSVFTAASGERVRFSQVEGQWQATIQADSDVSTLQRILPVVGPADVDSFLSWLQGQDKWTSRARIHILHTSQAPYGPYVYLGKAGLSGGMPGGEEDGKEDGKEDREPPAVPTSVQDLVDRYNKETDSGAKSQCEKVLLECNKWFQEQDVSNLVLCRGEMSEYIALAHIKAGPGTQQVLESYRNSLFNRVEPDYKNGDEVLLEALAYTLSVIDTGVFKGNTASLTRLATTLLDRLNPKENHLNQVNYVYYHSMLSSLHQVFALMREVSGNCLGPKTELYKSFKAKIQELKKESAGYYPIRYHVQLIEQSLSRLEAANSGFTRSDAGHALWALLYFGQVVVNAITLNPDIEALEIGYEHFRELVERPGIKKKDWYDTHQLMYFLACMSLEKEKPEHFEQFKKHLSNLTIQGIKSEGHYALHFGVGKQLKSLSLHGPTLHIRQESIKLLADKAWQLRQQISGLPDERHKVLAGWREDLAAIAAQSKEGEDRKKTKDALHQLLENSEEKVNALIEAAKSKSDEHSSTISVSNSLFKEICQRLKDKEGPPRLRDYIPQRNVRDDDYVECEEATKKVRKFLEQEGICVVCGPGGSGKSTLAVHYAADASKRDDRQVTRFVPADSREKLIAGLQYVVQELWNDYQFLAEIFREAPVQHCQELYNAIYNAIYNALEKSGQYLCLILDNAQDVDWVRDCASCKDKKRIQIIVTTRDPKAVLGYAKVQVSLTGFSATEAEKYIAKRLEPIKDRYQPDEQAIKKLIATVGSSPLGLELATGYLLTNSLSTVETYLEALRSAAPESGVIPQVDMGLADLADPLSQQVMRYSTWLDADFIPVSLLKAILEKESLGALQEILTPLETLSLVTVSTNKQGTDQGIRIHQDVQKSCAHYRGWVEGAHISESDLLSRLSSALTQVLDASSTPNEGEEARQKYLQHVTSVLASAMQSSAFAKDKKEVVSQWVPLLIAYAGPKWEAQKTSVVWDALLPHGQALFDAIDTKDSFQEKERYQLARYLAYACHVTARFEEGNKWAEECLCIARENHGHQNHPSVAHALRSVGISLVELGRHEEALQYKLEALEMHKRLDEEGEADKEDVARAWSDVASSYSQLGRREEALACQRVVLAMRERLWPAGKHPEIAHTLNSIGELLSHLEKYEEALEFKEKALKMRRELFNDKAHPDIDKDHPDIRRSLASVGIGYEQMGDLNKALEYKEKALEMSRRLYKDRKHPDIARSLNDFGETLIKQDQLEEGLGKLEEALAMRKEIYGKDRPHHYTAQSLNSVGRALALLSRRKLEESRGRCQDAVDMLEKVYPKQDHDYKVQALRQLGESLKLLGDLERGEQRLKEASEMQERLVTLHSR